MHIYNKEVMLEKKKESGQADNKQQNITVIYSKNKKYFLVVISSFCLNPFLFYSLCEKKTKFFHVY